jgi:hypothetical protein
MAHDEIQMELGEAVQFLANKVSELESKVIAQQAVIIFLKEFLTDSGVINRGKFRRAASKLAEQGKELGLNEETAAEYQKLMRVLADPSQSPVFSVIEGGKTD